MSLIGSILNPTQPQTNSANQGASAENTSETEDTNSVSPVDESSSAGSSSTGTNSANTGTGGNGGTAAGSQVSSESSDRTSATVAAGSSTQASEASASRQSETHESSESEAVLRFRAENAGTAFNSQRSVVERLFEIDPNTSVTDIISRIEISESDEAKISAQSFIERLSEVRQAEAPLQVDQDGPVFVDTNDSGEPVGRYDKSA